MSDIHSGICPKVNSFAPLLIINGKNFYFHDPYGNRLTEDYSKYDPSHPYWNTVNNPAIGYQEKSEQLVKSTRNANGQVVSQTINRRLNKFENLYWPYLSRYDVNWLKKQIAKFECEHFKGSIMLETKVGWLFGTNAEVKYDLHMKCLRCNEENVVSISGSGLTNTGI